MSFNGATLRTRGIPKILDHLKPVTRASMGPRLGRVEYKTWPLQLLQ